MTTLPEPEAETMKGGAGIHALKTWPTFFEAVLSGRKRYELREYDRPFMVGDMLALQEYEIVGTVGCYTGRETRARIIYMTIGPTFGLSAGHCILGIEVLP